MNRTTDLALTATLLALLAAAGARAQSEAPDKAQDPAIEKLLGEMRQAEAAAKSVSMQISTTGAYPGGLHFETQGTLRVLRGAHPASHTTVEFQFGNGLSGSTETVSNADGVFMRESNPTFGEVLLQMDNETLADLEWAGKVLQRDDLVPGTDSRAAAPLGSELIAELRRNYALAVLSHRDLDGQSGMWIGGDLEHGLQPESDPELLLPDRVELFVREPDHAVLEVVHLQNGQKEPVQRIRVQKLVVDQPMDAATFQLDLKGEKPRDIKQHEQSWAPLRRLLAEAEAKSKEKRPSARPPEPAKTPDKAPDKTPDNGKEPQKR